MSQSKSLLSSYSQKTSSIDFREIYKKQHFCMKKKVLILGLDGVGKTNLFSHLINHNKQSIKIQSLPHPTIGYNVETIKLHCHHLCHRRSHKITLWDCGGQSSLRSLWSYYLSNTSLLVWLINIYDRSRLDLNLQLLSKILLNSTLNRVPVLIILYDGIFHSHFDKEKNNQNLLTNLEVAFRFLATLSTFHASTFKWQVININSNNNDDFKKIRQSFIELMEL